MLEGVKRLLGFTDDAKDKLLNQIIGTAESRLKLKLGGLDAVPDVLGYIVVEVTVSRYNRISDEGASAKSVDGVSTTWLDDDFVPYLDDIEAWLRQQDGKRKIRFI